MRCALEARSTELESSDTFNSKQTVSFNGSVDVRVDWSFIVILRASNVLYSSNDIETGIAERETIQINNSCVYVHTHRAPTESNGEQTRMLELKTAQTSWW